MKKRIIIFTLAFTLLAALFAFSSLASDVTPTTEDAGVWQIKSESGEITVSYDFFDGLQSADDGDTLTLLADYIELDEIFTLRTGKSFTVDLGSSKIVYPSNTITEPVLNIRGSTSLTVLANGAEVYLQNNVRSFISILDTASLTVLGEGDGFSVYAPDAVDAGGSATVELHNVYFMKNSGNMMGMLCARGSSTVTAYDSTFVSKGGGNAVYTCASGSMSLYNSRVVSLDFTSAAQIADSSTLYAEDTVFSCTVKNSGGLTVGKGCYMPAGSSFATAEGTCAIDCSLTATIPVRSFFAPDAYTAVTASGCSIAYYIASDPTVTAAPTDSSVWRVENGEETYYTDSFCYPLYGSREGDRLSLLRDVALPTLCKSKLNAEWVDLADNSLALTLPHGISAAAGACVFDVAGAGNFTLTAGGVISLPITLIRSSRTTLLNLDGASLSLLSVATVTAADLTVTGGDIKTEGVALSTVGQADVYLSSCSVVSGASAVISGRGVYATGTLLAALDASYAVSALGTVGLSLESYAFGDISAAKITATESVYFNTPPSQNADFLAKPLAEPRLFEKYPELSFSYCASRLVGEVHASFDMSNDVTLFIYVPQYVYTDPDAFTLISVDGIVYTPAASDGSAVELDGEPYLRFSYPYIYASDINERGELRLSAYGVGMSFGFTVRDLMVSSFNASGSTSFRCAAATYLDYAFSATGYAPDAELSELLYPFVSRENVPVPAVPDMLRSVFFDTEEGVVALYPAQGVELSLAVIRWGDGNVTLSAENGVIRIPYLRLDPSVSIKLFYSDNGEDKRAELGILSLYATVYDSPGHSTALLRKYLSYLILISRL